MIQTFSNRDPEPLFLTVPNRRFTTITRVALRKLIQMNRVRVLHDLTIPPGLYTIRINGFLTLYVSQWFTAIFES